MGVANKIDYGKLFNALEFYKGKGFTYQDVAWSVSPAVSAITRPNQTEDFYLSDTVLVASAEQSFLQMMTDYQLVRGRHCAISPCFRDEQADALHGQYFMKVELIDTLNISELSLFTIMFTAHEFFSQYIACHVEKTGDYSYDIVAKDNGIELGSYGIRSHEKLNWIYATGCAEPRLSYALTQRG